MANPFRIRRAGLRGTPPAITYDTRRRPFKYGARRFRIGIPVKRKSGKSMLDIDEKVKVVHFNVGSGYVSYLEEDQPGSKPRVRGILLDKGKDAKKKV